MGLRHWSCGYFCFWHCSLLFNLCINCFSWINWFLLNRRCYLCFWFFLHFNFSLHWLIQSFSFYHLRSFSLFGRFGCLRSCSLIFNWYNCLNRICLLFFYFDFTFLSFVFFDLSSFCWFRGSFLFRYFVIFVFCWFSSSWLCFSFIFFRFFSRLSFRRSQFLLFSSLFYSLSLHSFWYFRCFSFFLSFRSFNRLGFRLNLFNFFNFFL